MHAKPQFRVYMMHDLGALRRARPTAIAVPLVISFCLELSELRDEQEFTSTERDAKQLAQKAGAETKYTCKTICRVKRFHDERVTDESLTDMRNKFKVETLFCLVELFSSKSVTDLPILGSMLASFLFWILSSFMMMTMSTVVILPL